MMADFLLAVGIFVSVLALAGWVVDTAERMRRR